MNKCKGHYVQCKSVIDFLIKDFTPHGMNDEWADNR